MKPELFHATNDSASATARRRVVELGIEHRVRFRNIFYPEVQADFTARGGRMLPALWTGETLIEGESQVVAALEAL